MRRISLFLTALLLCTFVSAQTVDVATAQKAGTAFLLSKGLIKPTDTLSLTQTYSSADGLIDCFYVFNVGEGFILVSADTRSVPILGYSFNGNFGCRELPDNFAGWLEGYRADIERGIRAQAPANDSLAREWKSLLDGTVKPAPAAKADEFLLTSTWEQGSGYNNYCPVMDGEHVVVGCVATAMAQIIHYWEYPHRGFGSSSYRHSVYGLQAVDFDTVDYNYSLMPDHLTRSSSAAERDMVSRLCYHCGVTVQMNYQNPSHTTGSGAHSTKVADALRHFGYTDAVYILRSTVNDDTRWKALIRQEIDARRPIYYSGASTAYGHAFVLDGYNNQNRFHFNWGWGGYSDGFYSLNTMQGFTASNDMVIGIQPSGWEGTLEHFLVSPEGRGDGTSWSSTNGNLSGALILASLVDREIWMLEGTYTGDTSADYVYTLSGAGTIYGGFAGTETSLNQRNMSQHPTILSGSGRKGVLKVIGPSRSTLVISDIILEDGYSAGGDCISISKSTAQADHITVRRCLSDSGCVATFTDCRVRYSRFEDNSAPVVCRLDGAALRQSIVAQNNADALRLENEGRVANSTIVSNAGRGIILAHKRCTSINNIVWNNDTDIVVTAVLSDTALRSCAYVSDTLIGDTTSILLSPMSNDPQGPRFVSAPSGRGRESIACGTDWHLAQGSVCINAGERLRESMYDGDFDATLRCRQGVIDLGCYESNYPVGIAPVAAIAPAVYPNPATTQLRLTGCRPGEATLLDALGRTCRTFTLTASEATLSLEGLPAGVYFLQLQDTILRVVKH